MFCSYLHTHTHTHIHIHIYLANKPVHLYPLNHKIPAVVSPASSPLAHCTHKVMYSRILKIFTVSYRLIGVLLLPAPTFSMPTYLRCHQGETWKVFETVFLNHFPDPAGRAAWRDNRGRTDKGRRRKWCYTSIFSKGSGGTPSDTDGRSDRLETIPHGALVGTKKGWIFL